AAAIGMADEHEIAQPFVFDDAKHIGNVQGEVDARAEQVCSVAETGVRRCEHVVPAGAQAVDDALPGPAAMPGAVNEDEGLGVSGWHVASASSLFSLHAVKTWMRGSSPRMTLRGQARFHRSGVACGKAGNGPQQRLFPVSAQKLPSRGPMIGKT